MSALLGRSHHHPMTASATKSVASATHLQTRVLERTTAAAWRKPRCVSSLRQLDNNRVAAACAGVILDQPGPQPGRFAPYNRVLLRVVIWPAAEYLDGDQGFLELIIPTFQMTVYNEPQESGQALVMAEPGASEHPFQLVSYGLCLYVAGCHRSQAYRLFSARCKCITPACSLFRL